MNPIDAIDVIGLKDAIKRSFSSVFSELNLASEAWFQKTKLLTIGRDNYADYVAARVGVFPLFATNKSASVEATYIRVNISTDIERDRYRNRIQVEEGLRRHKLGADSDDRRQRTGMNPVESISSNSGGFALVGLPGSGKTTIFRSIAVTAARGQRIRGRKRVPIYLAARDLAFGRQGVLEASIALFTELGINEAGRVIELLFKSGNCIVLLDGLDETDSAHQTALLKEILEIKAKHNSCVFCVSARPTSLSVGLADFIKWETLPLSLTERLSFVKKWFSLVDPVKGRLLLERCQNRPEMLDLGSSPLLLSIVCALFYNDLDIPSEPDELYDRALHGLLGGWDAFRSIARQTILADVPVKKRLAIVSWLAAGLFEAGNLAFTPSDVRATSSLQQVTAVLRSRSIDADDLLPALYNDFGLLVERAPNLYSFSHLTIHEYLVAKHIADNRQEIRLLDSHRSDPKWAEIVRLTAKILPNADEFMSCLQTAKILDDSDSVSLLESVWLSRPVCSVQLRKKLMTQIAMKIDGVASRYSVFEVIESATTSTLVICIQLPEETADLNSKRLGYLFPNFVTYCLPGLFGIIRASGFTYEDLGLKNSRLFRQLDKAKVSEIGAVKFKNTKTGRFVGLTKAGILMEEASDRDQ